MFHLERRKKRRTYVTQILLQQKVNNFITEQNNKTLLAVADTVRTSLGPKGMDKMVTIT